MKRAGLLAPLALLVVLPGVLSAQRLAAFDPAPVPAWPAPAAAQESAPPPPPTGRLVAGSALGASVGALAGWTVGVLAVLATGRYDDSWDDAWTAAAVAVLAGSAGSVVLGGVGSRIGVRAAGGRGGPLGKHVLASAAGWGASLVLLNALYANDNGGNDNAGVQFGVLIGAHGLVTALLAPKR